MKALFASSHYCVITLMKLSIIFCMVNFISLHKLRSEMKIVVLCHPHIKSMGVALPWSGNVQVIKTTGIPGEKYVKVGFCDNLVAFL